MTIYAIMFEGVDKKMIKLTHVVKIYKTGVRAINDLSLTIEPGEFVYVIGTTGAGKSTFIKLLYREEKSYFRNCRSGWARCLKN